MILRGGKSGSEFRIVPPPFVDGGVRNPGLFGGHPDVATLGKGGKKGLLPLQPELVRPLPPPLNLAAFTANNAHEPDPYNLSGAISPFGLFCQGILNRLAAAASALYKVI